ncbi:hypothetical protein [Actinomyces procaprae]|uniref:hypothetical protein n=1 Tax=Actinomyces procaprae TaxID=2560010 RepID=UPI0010A225AD|nr:hypothetical protein [Actinomyces procaprae]
MLYGYANTSTDDYGTDSEGDSSSDPVDNLKKLAIEHVMNRSKRAQLMPANNPKVMGAAGVGAAMGV